MIKNFLIGEKYKDISGNFLNTFDLWKNKNLLEINGYSSQDYNSILDFNRPFFQLSENEIALNNILKELIKANFKKNIICGCEIIEESLDWRTSSLDESILYNRYNEDKVIPFIPCYSIDGNLIDDFTVNFLATKSYIINNGIIKTSTGDFYTIKSDIVSFFSLISKILLLDFSSSNTKFSDNGRYEDYIFIEEINSTKKFKCSIDRLPLSDSDITASEDPIRRTISNIEFDSIEELYDNYLDGTFNLLGTTDIEDALYLRLNHRLFFAKSLTNFLYKWNFVIFNETNNRIEVYFNTIDTNNLHGDSTPWQVAKNNLTAYLFSLSQSYVLLYSIAIDYSGNDNLIIEENNVTFNQTTMIGYTVADNTEKLNLVNSGLLNTHDRIKQDDNGKLFKWDGFNLIQEL